MFVFFDLTLIDHYHACALTLLALQTRLILDENGLIEPYKTVAPRIVDLPLLTDSSAEENQMLEMAVLLPAFTPVPSACMFLSRCNFCEFIVILC